MVSAVQKMPKSHKPDAFRTGNHWMTKTTIRKIRTDKVRELIALPEGSPNAGVRSFSLITAFSIAAISISPQHAIALTIVLPMPDLTVHCRN
jgi:hypothetical protein